MSKLRIRTVAQAALALRPSNSSRKFQDASFIESARDLQVHDKTFDVTEGDVHHHYAPSQQQPTLADVFRTLPDAEKVQADALSKATAGTGLGFLQSDTYQKWITGNLKTMVGQGKVGAGKTLQASIVINDLEERAKASDGQMCVAYVYLLRGEASEITVRSIFEALVKQTVEHHSKCLALAEEQYYLHLQEGTQPTEGELFDLLSQFSRIIPTTFYVIEALDAALADVQLTLVRKLSSLSIKLFITSRPLPDAEEIFSGAEVVQIVAQDHDLDLLIAQKLQIGQDLQGILQRGGPSLRELIVESVKSKCHGVFLHASLHLDALQECFNVREVKQLLQNFPLQVEDAYALTWKRLSYQLSWHVEIAKMVILWVVHAQRAMSVAELQHAIATDPDTFEFERDRLVPEPSLLPLCIGLVTVDDKCRLMQLCHSTAKPTLEKKLVEFYPHPRAYIASVCFTHLAHCKFPNSSISSKEDLQAALAADPLLSYAHQTWAFHALQALDNEALAQLAKKFIQSCQSFPAFIPLSGFDTFGPLHIAIASGMALSSIFANGVEDPNVLSNLRKISPLALASLLGNSSAAEELLALPDTRINIADVDGWTELHYACHNGLESVLKVLLRRPDVDINAKDKQGFTPLMRACYRGHDSCVKLLLACSATQVNVVDNNGETALMHACSREHEGTVKLLLDRPEIDINHLSHGRGRRPVMNALLIACMPVQGREGIIKMLLSDARTDRHLRTSDGLFPLLFIAGADWVEAVETIVESATEPQVCDPGFEGVTALTAAPENGRVYALLREFEARVKASGA